MFEIVRSYYKNNVFIGSISVWCGEDEPTLKEIMQVVSCDAYTVRIPVIFSLEVFVSIPLPKSVGKGVSDDVFVEYTLKKSQLPF